MDIEIKLKELVNSAAISKIDVVKDSTEFDMKKIESGLNKHNKAKNKDAKKVSLFNDPRKNYNENEFSEHINNEYINKYTNKKWSALVLCMKCRLIEDYCVEKMITDPKIIDNIKKTAKNSTKNLAKNNIDIITYDHLIGKITNIDITLM